MLVQHLLSNTPMCIDIPTELIHKEEHEIAIGADKIFYNDLQDVIVVQTQFETSCFSGDYI
jgi:glutamine phosphoribosylpyrophosphate amidotransferase